MNAITRLERWLDRRPGGAVREGTEPNGWLTDVDLDPVHGEDCMRRSAEAHEIEMGR